ncbi:phosphorylated CTD interacting factor 1 WW domain-containing protein [Pelagophyceae sp. CCMP2097]|nr:phosphorylated CTD interacting factor 1 WW domain-containing protein [Pelagophyceae sp. CCMP2097]
MSLNSAHYDKLAELYARQRARGGAVGEAIDEALFCVLARYEGIKGAGFQCAVPGAAFEALSAHLGRTIECFASPLNARYGRFFSAFPDLERRFGSLGSFFGPRGAAIRSGSFEANPPFVPEVMELMLSRITGLLGDAKSGALSFLVVLPDWGGGASAAAAARASNFNVAAAAVPATQHVFLDGAQHRVADQYRPSSWDTACVLLQNTKGVAKWPLDSATLGKIIADHMARPVRKPAWETRAGKGAAAPGRGAAAAAPDAKREDLGAWEARGPRKGGKKTARPPPAAPPAAAAPPSTERPRKKPKPTKPAKGREGDDFFVAAD